jgi:hypothetical protein
MLSPVCGANKLIKIVQLQCKLVFPAALHRSRVWVKGSQSEKQLQRVRARLSRNSSSNQQTVLQLRIHRQVKRQVPYDHPVQRNPHVSLTHLCNCIAPGQHNSLLLFVALQSSAAIKR